MKNCNHCGSPNSDDAKFCLKCGKSLNNNATHLTLSWREQGINKAQSIDINHPTNKKAGTIRLGRDPELCDLVLNDPKISRLHAEIIFNSQTNQFFIQNLRENNPILVNNQQLIRGSKLLNNGTTINLGDTQVQLMSDNLTPQSVATQINLPTQQNPLSTLSISVLLPLISTRKDLRQQAYFVPGVITVIWVVLLFTSLGKAALFNLLLASFLGFIGFYFIYQLCEKRKPFWILIIPVIVTPILLITPVWSLLAIVFRNILPGNLPNTNLLSAFISNFFGAGLAEELLKALPLFGLMWFSRWFKSPKMGIVDPLDGIILGAASGLGFTLYETLGQYVPNFAQTYGELVGLQLLIPRIVGSVFGHMAYSGYFGYYIGLSVLKPRRKWQILGTGYLIASTIHALWNTSFILSNWAAGLVGILAFCLLTGAILKARKIRL